MKQINKQTDTNTKMNKRKETEQKEFIDKSIEKINYKKTQAKIDDDLNRCCFKNCICSLALQL